MTQNEQLAQQVYDIWKEKGPAAATRWLKAKNLPLGDYVAVSQIASKMIHGKWVDK